MRFSAQGFSARFWSLIASTFLGFLGIGTVLPRLAPHIRHDLGGSDQSVGFIIGIFSFVALGARFFSGPLADRRGRKAAFLAGLVSCALAGLAYLMPFGISGVYLARILQGFGEACLYTGAAAWAVEVAGIDRGAQALGYLSSGIWGGISAGPLVGQWLGSFERAAAMQVISAIVAVILLSRVSEDYRPSPHPNRRRWVPPSLITPGIAVGFVNVHYPVITGFLILHLARHGNSGPAAFSAYAGVILLARFFLGGLPDRIQPRITFYAGLAAMALGLIVVGLGPSPAVAICATALVGLGFSFPWSSVAATVLRRSPESERGSAVSILGAFYDLFVGMSSFAAGAVSSRFGYSAAFMMAAAALGAAAIAGQFVFRTSPAEATFADTPEQVLGAAEIP
jgi:MFS family permease